MERPIDLVLLTGFLGAGKTTLLNQVLDAAAASTRRVGILMNEFGKIGVDGALVHKADGLSVFEVSDGSIFCTCKSASFVAGLRMFARLPERTRPERLIVEASGMSDPSGLTRLLRENRLAGDYSVVKVVCLVDANRFAKLVGTLPAVTRQLEAADLIVINKTDLAEEVQIDAAEEAASAANATARVVRASHGLVNEAELWEGESRDLAGDLVSCTVPGARPAALHFVSEDENGASRGSVERFLSRALEVTYRIKGWLLVDGTWYFISDNSGRTEWEEQQPPRGARPGLVVICAPENADGVAELWRDGIAS